jgi:transcriptional regulator of aromatic amino acid metabolism
MSTGDLDRKLVPAGKRVPQGTAPAAIPDFDLMSAARSEACVLLTGRDDVVRTVAYQVHRLSDRKQGPYTILDCGWPEDIIERALYGVFADPGPGSTDTPGRTGTVLLHQVGRLDRAVQSRLADRLMFLRGQRQPRWSRWRLLASTSEALLPRVDAGTFDDRLYYRLNVIHLVIPSDPAARSARGIHGVDEGFLLTYGTTHDARAHAAPPHRTGPRLGLRTW